MGTNFNYNASDFRGWFSKMSATKSSLACQKYIKSKGPKAFIVRVIHRRSKASFAWMINNETTFDDEACDALGHRFATNLTKTHGCTFVKLTGRACAEVVDIHDRVGNIQLTVDVV